MTTVITNANVATLKEDSPYGLVSDGTIALNGDKIEWVGKRSALPKLYSDWAIHDVSGKLITPALIDCHTHIVYGGNRAEEFEQRLLGATYEDVAKAGGGILSTVKNTRAASTSDLVTSALPRLDAMIAEGLSTIEIKSGYGLDCDSELNMLRAAKELATLRPIRVLKSFLGAHAVPPEYENRPDDYLNDVCIPTLKLAAAEGLVDYVDGFCEGIAFSAEQISLVFEAAKELSIPIKLHAEQLSHQGGVQVAAKFGALSADHVEFATEKDAKTMAAIDMVATILPGAYYTLRETQCPPIEHFRTYGVPMAVATDANPGSSPLFSPLLTLNMACTLFRLTPEEALRGMTQHAARALGLIDCGVITAGKRADLAVWDVSHPAELAYAMGLNPLKEHWHEGVLK